MKSTITKPLLRVATAYTSANNPKSSSPRPGVPLLCQKISPPSSTTTTTPTEARFHTSTTIAPRNNILFLQRNFSSATYPAPFKYSRSVVPLSALALIGTAVLYLGHSTAQALSFFPFSSKPSAATRMQDRLEKHGFVERLVVPDGNCQMRALSDQILGDEKYHKEVRLKIMDWLNAHEKFVVDSEGGATLGDFIDRDQFSKWGSYIAYMSKNGAWGDHITLLAAAEVYGVTISILSNVDDNGTGQYITDILPRSTKSTKTVHLSHWHEMHYNSLYPANSQLQVAA